MQPLSLLPSYTCHLYTEPDESIRHLSVLIFFCFILKWPWNSTYVVKNLKFSAKESPQ